MIQLTRNPERARLPLLGMGSAVGLPLPFRRLALALDPRIASLILNNATSPSRPLRRLTHATRLATPSARLVQDFLRTTTRHRLPVDPPLTAVTRHPISRRIRPRDTAHP